MAFSTKIILPDNLRSESLNSEFIELGKIYVNKKSSQDPDLDLNRNLLKFKFEVFKICFENYYMRVNA